MVLETFNPGWTWNILVSIDILANTVFFGDVETISARAGKAVGQAWADGLCYILDTVDPNHCADAAGV